MHHPKHSHKLNEYARDIFFAAALTFIIFIGAKGNIPFIATAFAASIYLSFINPYSKYSTAWSISASYIVAAFYGTILHTILKHELTSISIYYIAATFIIFALFAETITLIKAEHPPAAAVLVSFAYTEVSIAHLQLFSYLIILMIIIDYIFEKLLEHKKEIINTTEYEIKNLRRNILRTSIHNNKHPKADKTKTY